MKPLKITFYTLSLLFGSQVSAQGLYFETNSSFNLPLGSQEIGGNSTYNYEENMVDGTYFSSSSQEQIRGSFGQGVYLGLSMGYMITPTIGFELKAEQQLAYSVNSISRYSSTTVDPWSGNSSYVSSYEETVSGSMTRLTPSFVFQLPGTKFSPYAQFGAILGFGKIMGQYEDIDTDVTQGTYIMNGGLALGMNGEFGLNIKFTEKLSLNTGLSFSALSYAPARGELIEYSENGVDMLPQMSVSEKEVEFTSEVSSNSNSSTNQNEPDQMLKMWFPFSAVGLNIGLKFSL